MRGPRPRPRPSAFLLGSEHSTQVRRRAPARRVCCPPSPTGAGTVGLLMAEGHGCRSQAAQGLSRVHDFCYKGRVNTLVHNLWA